MNLPPFSFPTTATRSKARIDILPTHLPEWRQSVSTSDPLKVEENGGSTLDAKSLGVHIRMLLPTLTALEARVVSTLVNSRTVDETTLLKWAADYAQVSEEMIVKIARKLGFSGFRSLGAALAEYNRLPMAEVHEELAANDPASCIVEKVFRASINALQQTLEVVSYEAVKDAASHLYLARHRDFYGVGGSAQVARDAAYKFLRIGIRASVFDDCHMMLMSAWLLEKSDVVVAFSHSGHTMVVIDAVQQARKNGAKIIAITNKPNSLLAQESDLVFCTSVNESPLMGENAAARIAQLNIIDALFLAVAQKNRGTAERNLGRTISAVRALKARY